jgi:hypothetical protein
MRRVTRYGIDMGISASVAIEPVPAAPAQRAIQRAILTLLLTTGTVATLHAATLADWPLPSGARAAQPSLAARGGDLWLSWIEPHASGHRLRIARDAGAGFADVDDAAQGERWFVNWADFPTLVALPDGSFAIHLLQKSADTTYAYDVRLLRSADGKRWSDGVIVHDDGTRTEHGFASIFPWRDDQLAIAWLDGRQTAGGAHDHGAGGMTLRAAVFEGDEKRSEWQLDARTCDCCQTDAAISAGGPLLVYRDRGTHEVRDIAITRYRDGAWTAPAMVHADGWVMPGCPVNGPAVAAQGSDVYVAWYSAAGDAPKLLLAHSVDDGAAFAAPVTLDASTQVQGRVDLALDADAVYVLWITEDARAQSLWLSRRSRRAPEVETMRIAGLARGRGTGFPRMALRDGVAHVVWTDVVDGAPRLAGKRVDFRAPAAGGTP